jgi:hypothetical protein
MPFEDIVHPEQIAVLTAALEEICLVAGIDAESTGRDDTARLLTHLYRNGHRTTEQLRAALDPETLQARFG